MRYHASDGSLWDIDYEPPPVPVRDMDWNYAAADYDGPGDDRYGFAATRDLAIAAIEDNHVEGAA